MNYPTVSDVFFGFDGKLFDADWPALEKLQGSNCTVLTLNVTKLPKSEDCRWGRLEIADTSVNIETRFSRVTAASICRREDRSWSQLVDLPATSLGHGEELWFCPISIFYQSDQLLPVAYTI